MRVSLGILWLGTEYPLSLFPEYPPLLGPVRLDPGVQRLHYPPLAGPADRGDTPLSAGPVPGPRGALEQSPQIGCAPSSVGLWSAHCARSWARSAEPRWAPCEKHSPSSDTWPAEMHFAQLRSWLFDWHRGRCCGRSRQAEALAGGIS